MSAPELRPHSLDAGDRSACAALQDLLERCADYLELDEGAPPGPGAARELLDAGPPGVSRDHKFVHGWARTVGEPLVAVTDTIAGYPDQDSWFLGLLLVDPAWRRRGVGAAILRQIEAMARAAGAVQLYLAVLERNPDGQQFWQRQGFAVVDRVRRLDPGRPDPVFRMVKPLG